ncbi:MAG TPA: TetR/AcrR family transcriptional regulator [Hydrogenophilus thermoluteolus]|nr:TetR/AcrR family transcriptional regulator [Hydrogenophilus thermoluteolus]
MKRERSEIVDQAMRLFWARGFHGTSMRDLQQVLDLRPGSIYAAFGSKEGLFREVLRYYTQGGQTLLRRLRGETGSPLTAIERYFQTVVLELRHRAPNPQCLLVKSLLELSDDEDGELVVEVRNHLKVMQGCFAELLREAQANGEIPRELDPDRTAHYLQVQLMGLRSYARLSEDEAVIGAVMQDLFARLRRGDLPTVAQPVCH